MKLIRLDSAALTAEDVLFRLPPPAPVPVWLASAIAAFVCLGLVGNGKIPAWLGYSGAGAFAVVGGLRQFGASRRARDAESWLVAFDGRRLLLKLRSPWLPAPSHHLPGGIELPLPDIHAVGGVTVDTRLRDANVCRVSVFLEIELAAHVDLQPLRDRLCAEYARPRGISAERPVTLAEPRTIRLEWSTADLSSDEGSSYLGPAHTGSDLLTAESIVPKIEEAISLLGRRVRTRPWRNVAFDFADLNTKLHRDAALAQLRALAVQGHGGDVTRLAKFFFCCDDEEARRFADQAAEGREASVARHGLPSTGLSSGG